MSPLVDVNWLRESGCNSINLAMLILPLNGLPKLTISKPPSLLSG
jgi:hypothetical protein